MSLEPLEIVDCPMPAVAAPGALPELKWLLVDALRVDMEYQRPLMKNGRANIARIVAEFRWSRFSPLIVMSAGDGLYCIIDGQHRAIAARRLGIVSVPCQIVAATSSEAASIFAAVNGNVTPMTPQNLYRAALAAREAWAVEIDRMTRKARVEVLTYPVELSKQKARQTMIVATLRQRIRMFGADTVAIALEGMAQSRQADVPGFIRSGTLDQAIGLVRATPDALANRPAVVKALSEHHYTLPSSCARRVPASTVAAPLRIVTADMRDRVRALAERRYSKSAIAATLRIPYSQVEEALT